MGVLKNKRGIIIIIGFVIAVICFIIGMFLLFNQDNTVEKVKEQNNNMQDEIKTENDKEVNDNDSQKNDIKENNDNLNVDEQQIPQENKTDNNSSSTTTNNKNNTTTQKTTSKNVSVDESIGYSTQEIKEVNLPRGQKQTSQAGKNGVKRITYKVTYNSNGTEISRTKISENVISQPVNQIIKVGVSDFNLNTSKLENEVYSMFACTSNQLVNDGGYYCNETEKNFSGVFINGTLYITGIYGQNSISNVRPLIALKPSISADIYNGNYGGTNYYFSLSSGNYVNRALTQSDCNKYGLACGRW